MRTLSTALGLALALGGQACGRGDIASRLAPMPDLHDPAQARCGVIKSRARPLIIEWPSADRGALEGQIKRGDRLVVVRYEGCAMEVLRSCRARGGYGYSAVERKEEAQTLKTADELYARIPLGAAQLEGELARHGALRLAMTIVGTYDADRLSIPRGELEGECEGATHVVTGLTVGAFALASGSGASIKAGAAVTGLGAGGGAGSRAERGYHRSDGDPDACRGYAQGGPPRECGALLRLEVEPIDAEAAPAEAPPPRRSRRARPCPEGAALVPGGVYSRARSSWGGNTAVADLCVLPHEVTVAEYGRCVRAGECSEAPSSVSWSAIDDATRADQSELCNAARARRRGHPVNCVSWHQADSYCRAQGGRLPSEDEWEWIARGGDQHRSYPWGEDDPDARLVNACGKECSKEEPLYPRRDGHAATAPVDSFRGGRGRWRIADLAGNVWEWTSSGDDDASHVIRGGGFLSADDDEVRVRSRDEQPVRDRRADLGFRCVWEPKRDDPAG